MDCYMKCHGRVLSTFNSGNVNILVKPAKCGVIFAVCEGYSCYSYVFRDKNNSMFKSSTSQLRFDVWVVTLRLSISM